MAHLSIQCQNCGAKYKIPETFPGDFAKCKACGTKIDVNAARGEETASAGASPRDSTKRSVGGTRKPRVSAADAKSSTRSKRGAEDQDSPKKGRRVVGGGRRRGRRGEEQDEDNEEEGGRRGYQKKKDNTPLILGGSVVVLAIVAVIFFMFWGGNKPDDTGKNDKIAEKSSADIARDKLAQEIKDLEAKDATAKKDRDAKADEADAKKKKAAKKPKPVIKKTDEIKTATDVFKPSILEKLPMTEATTDEEATAINEQLDYLKEGGGLSYIRAPKKLAEFGVKMIPISVNRLMTLDYSKAEDNQYAFAISEAIKVITEFELAFDPARIIDEFELTQGHANAKKVKDLHYLSRKKWTTAAMLKADIKSRNK